MFYALAEGKIDTGDLRYVHELSDIESLNRRALKAELEVTAVSIHAYAYLRGPYALLTSGSSMGDGYGPRLVSGPGRSAGSRGGRSPPCEPSPAASASRCPASSPPPTSRSGSSSPTSSEVVVPFDQIDDAVLAAQVDLGLLIHEGQLTYQDQGLHLWADMGEWWLAETGLPSAARRQRGAPGPRPAGSSSRWRGTSRPASSTPGPPGAGAGPRQAVQPGHRRRKDRPLRGDVRERLDRGLRRHGAAQAVRELLRRGPTPRG